MIVQAVSTFCRLAPGYPDSERGLMFIINSSRTRAPMSDSTEEKKKKD